LEVKAVLVHGRVGFLTSNQISDPRPSPDSIALLNIKGQRLFVYAAGMGLDLIEFSVD
jgi:hypothetical protein